VLTYTAFSLPFTVFVLTGYFKTLPRELEEAAELDGCSVFRTFWSIMFPMAKPGLVAVAIFNVIGMWNQYLLALISITDPQKRTLPLGIANLLMIQQYRTNWGALLAGLMITILPLLILYILFHSHITRGMTAGALKG
jgi:ABC-type glycerol-3-phosphate transport system permease component